MNIAGFDIATRSGITIVTPQTVRAYSWSPRAKRPPHLKQQEIDAEYEAVVAEEFRDHIRPMLVAEKISYVAFEKNRTADYDRKKKTSDPSSEWFGRVETERGSSNLSMVRALMLCAHLCGLCQRLGIPCVAVTADDWRHSMLGHSRAPRGTPDGRKYLKEEVKAVCRLLKIEVPNNDAADSVGVAFWLQGYLKLARFTLPGELPLQGVAA